MSIESLVLSRLADGDKKKKSTGSCGGDVEIKHSTRDWVTITEGTPTKCHFTTRIHHHKARTTSCLIIRVSYENLNFLDLLGLSIRTWSSCNLCVFRIYKRDLVYK